MLSQIREQSAGGDADLCRVRRVMVLCADLQDLHGRRYPMAGCFPLTTRMRPRLTALGYREVRLSRDTIIGEQGLSIRGHEFHYSELADHAAALATVYRIAGPARGWNGPQKVTWSAAPWEVTSICISEARPGPRSPSSTAAAPFAPKGTNLS